MCTLQEKVKTMALNRLQILLEWSECQNEIKSVWGNIVGNQFLSAWILPLLDLQDLWIPEVKSVYR